MTDSTTSNSERPASKLIERGVVTLVAVATGGLTLAPVFFPAARRALGPLADSPALMTAGFIAACLLLAGGLVVWVWRGPRHPWLVRGAALLATGAGGLAIQPAPTYAVSLAALAAVLAACTFADLGSRRRAWGLLVAFAVLLVHAVGVIGLQAGVPLFSDREPMSLRWGLAVLLLAVGVLAAGGFRRYVLDLLLGEAGEDGRPGPGEDRWRRQVAVVTAIGLVVALGAAARGYLKTRLAEMRHEAASQLADVTALKASHIEAWRRERLGDIRSFAQVPFLAERVAQLLRAPEAGGVRNELQHYLDAYRAHYGYRSVGLVAPSGELILAAHEPAKPWEPLTAATLTAALAATDAVIRDLYLTADEDACMEFVAALRLADGTPVGAIVLRSSAYRHLYPLLREWPGAASAATALVRREGDAVVYVSPLRLDPQAVLRLRLPLDQPDLPAARALREGRVDPSEGRDYRGVPVLWLARPVAESPWVLVSKVDRAEVLAPLRLEAWRIALFFGVTVLTVGLVAGRYWRGQRRAAELRQQAAERDRRAAFERLAVVMRHANDVIILFDERMRIVEANERALAVYGRTRPELLQLTARDLRAAVAQSGVEGQFAEALTPAGILFETVHRRHDGSTFDVEVSSRRVELEGRPHVLSIIRDITERKRAAHALARQEARFHLIFDRAPVGFSLGSEQEGGLLVNPEHVRITGVAAADSGTPGIFARVTHPEDYARQVEAQAPYLRGEVDHFTVQKRYLHADGSVIWAEMTSRHFHDPATGERYSLTTLVDITQQKRHEAEIERLNRMYFVISQVNQALVRARDRASLFREVCTVLVEQGRFRIAWIGWRNPETDLIDPVAIAGDPTGYLEGIRISATADLPEGRGPSGTAFREGRSQVLNDFFGTPSTTPWRERAARAGFQSVMAVPLRCEGEVRGVLNVYAEERDFFAPREVGLLEETAGDVSFALDVFAGEERRREAEVAVRASEHRLQFLLTATPAVIYSLRAGGDHRLTFISHNLEGVLGYSPGQALAAPGFWRDHLHPDDAAEAIAALGRLAEHDVVTREYRFRHADGSWRWMHDEMRLVRDPHGRPLECVGYWIDVTPQHEAGAALRAREEIFSTIVGQAVDSIALIEADTGRFAEFNTAAHESLGYSRAEFAGFAIADIQGEHSSAEIRQNIGRIIQGQGSHFETRHRHRNGELRDVRVSARAIQVGGRSYLTAIWTDITAAKRADAEMRKLSLAVDQSPLSIVITDLTGAIEYANPRFCTLTGYRLEDIRGKNPRVLKSGKVPPAVYADLWRTITAGRVWRGELVNRKKNGELFTELVVVTPVTDAQGRPTHFLALKEDISERRRTELALEASEAKFRRLLAMSPLPLGHSDGTGQITFLNERFQQLFGYRHADVPTIAAWLARAYPVPEYRERIRVRWEETLARARTGGGEFAGFECDVTCADGQIRTVEISGITLGDELLVAFVDLTERIRTERRLRQLTRTIEQAPLSVAITDLTGAIEYVNPCFMQVTGYSLAEVVGRNPRVLKSGDTPPAVYVEMWRTLVAGQVWRGELRNRKKNGEIYVESAIIAPVVDETGRPTHYVALKEDITERKRMEQSLREVQDRYRLIADNTADTIWLYDLPGARYAYVSPAVTRLLGYAPEELVGQSIDMSLPPAARALIGPLIAQRIAAFLGGDESVRSATHEFEQRRKDGSLIPTEVVTTILSDAHGRPDRLLGVTRDITQRRQADAALRRSEEQYRLIAENTSDAIWILDLERQVFSYMSPASERLLGIPSAELIGQPITRALTPAAAADAARKIRDRAAAVLAGDRSAIYRVATFDHAHRDGRIVRGEVVSTLLLDDGGVPRQLLGISRDVTERERAENELRQSRDRLAKAEQMAHLGNWEFDLATQQISWSEEVFRIFEIDPGRHPTLAEFLDRVHPDDREAVEQRFQEAVAQRGNFLLTHRLLCPGGRVKHVESSGEVQLAPDGTPLRALGTVQDITERRQVELELHDLVKQFRAMHAVALVLDEPQLAPERLAGEIARHLPSAVRHPLLAQAGVRIEAHAGTAGAAGPCEREISAAIEINGRPAGLVRVGYVASGRGDAAADFTARERETIESIARTIGLSLSARESFAAIQRFNADLEDRIRQRTTELAERNREVQALLEAIPDMVVRLRRDGTLLSCQSAKGVTPLAELCLQPGPKAETSGARELFRAVCAAGERASDDDATVTSEVRLALGRAEVIVELRAAPNGPDEFVVFVRDITARRQLEDALQHSQDRLALAARAGKVGIWEYDLAEERLVWDEQMCRLYGLAPEQFGGAYDVWRNGLHPEDRERAEAAVQRAIRGEGDFDTEFRVVWPDGSVHHIRGFGLVQRDAAGRPSRMVGTNWDVTAEKAAADALRRSESILQQMFQATPMGFLLVDDRTGAILHFNHRFCEIWGLEHLAGPLHRGELKAGDVVAESRPRLVEGAAYAESCRSLQDERNRSVVDDEIAFTDGRTIRRFTTQIRDPEDRYYGRFFIFEDVTPQKRLAREIAENLEKERQVSEMKTRFISVTSHEFRTPMAAAMASAELIRNHQDRLTPAKRGELVERIIVSLRRMTEMLEDILTLNRIDAGRVQTQLADIELEPFVHSVVDEVRLGDRDAHRFVIETEGPAQPCCSDANLLHHILSNLLSNAARYSSAGKTVTTRLEFAGPDVLFSVRDEGIGIPAADLERIFEPFERASNVGTIKGTGLGLNIVQRMVEMLGGRITVESELGRGSCFTVRLPRLPAPSGASLESGG